MVQLVSDHYSMVIGVHSTWHRSKPTAGSTRRKLWGNSAFVFAVGGSSGAEGGGSVGVVALAAVASSLGTLSPLQALKSARYVGAGPM